MKVSVFQSKKTVRLCYGLGGALLLASGLGGAVLGNETAERPAVSQSAGDEAALQHAQEGLLIAREALERQEGLSDAARHARLAALDDSMETYLSMMKRLREVKLRDPNLDSAEAKTLLRSASGLATRFEQQGEETSSGGDLLDDGIRAVALLGLFSLFAGLSLSFPATRGILKPFRALVGLVTAARTT